ncbi:hypothetical protein D9M69_698510 [compost metagenome]
MKKIAHLIVADCSDGLRGKAENGAVNRSRTRRTRDSHADFFNIISAPAIRYARYRTAKNIKNVKADRTHIKTCHA